MNIYVEVAQKLIILNKNVTTVASVTNNKQLNKT